MLYQFRGIIYCYEVVGAWRAMPIMPIVWGIKYGYDIVGAWRAMPM